MLTQHEHDALTNIDGKSGEHAAHLGVERCECVDDEHVRRILFRLGGAGHRHTSFSRAPVSHAPLMNVSGVPSAGLTKIMSLGARRGASMARKTTGLSKISGSACTVRRLKKSRSPGANSLQFELSPIQKLPLPERM